MLFIRFEKSITVLLPQKAKTAITPFLPEGNELTFHKEEPHTTHTTKPFLVYAIPGRSEADKKAG